jgi:murein DD-endopeptidase MepM/ murein hydrolase activator NlpD
MKNYSIVNKLPLYILNIALVYLSVFLVFFCISLFTGSGPETVNSTNMYSDSSNSLRSSNIPNVVTVGLSDAIDKLGKNMKIAVAHIGAMGKYVAETASYVAATIAKETANILELAVKSTANFIFYVVKQTASLIFYIVKQAASFIFLILKTIALTLVTIFGYISELVTKSIVSVLRKPVFARIVSPSEYITNVSIIDSSSPEIQKAIVALEEENSTLADVKASNTSDQALVRWPTRGKITARFGVPHWPYQPVHTGLDISSQKASGVNPIYPFRAGTVIKTVKSYSGLGNYVEVDHGYGITSVYAHLASIAVAEGQEVTIETELGREGTTGVSTGVHLHFEIRINGQSTDPLPFLNG